MTRISISGDGKVTVISDSLYVALTTLADQIRDKDTFAISGHRHGLTWTVRAWIRLVRPCGCPGELFSAHTDACPVYEPVQDLHGARWVERDR